MQEGQDNQTNLPGKNENGNNHNTVSYAGINVKQTSDITVLFWLIIFTQ